MANFRYCGPTFACPVCGRTKNCRESIITGSVHCIDQSKRDDPPVNWRYVKVDGTGVFGVFFPDGTTTYRNSYLDSRIDASRSSASASKNRRDGSGKKTPPPGRYQEIIAELKSPTVGQRNFWLDELGLFGIVCPEILDVWGIKIYESNPATNTDSMATPEKDAQQKIIGVNLRHPAGRGHKTSYGQRGIYIREDWNAIMADPLDTRAIYLVEGVSDCIALTAMGHLAVGRPNNTGGIQHLAELLRSIPLARQIIVVGENDERTKDGVTRCPGRDGMEKTAHELADTLNRPISAIMPPEGVKDVRELILNRHADLAAKLTTLANVGTVITLALANAITVQPRPIVTGIPSPDLSDVQIVVNAGDKIVFPPIPWTARDCNPKADPFRPTPAPHCPSPVCLAMRNDAYYENWELFVDCRKLDCPHCSRVKRQQYIATCLAHLNEYAQKTAAPGDPAPTVWQFWCDARMWVNITRNLNSHHADYIKLNANGHLFIVSTEKPTGTGVNGLQEVSVESAIARLTSTINAMPLRPKCFTSSAAWSLIGEMRSNRDQGFKIIGVVDPSVSQQQIFEVMEHHGINVKHIGKQGPFWAWRAWVWHDKDTASDPEKVRSDIMFGEVMPEELDTDALFGNEYEPPKAQARDFALDW